MIHTLLTFFAPGALPEGLRATRQPQARAALANRWTAAARVGRVALQAAGMLADAIGFVALMLGCWLAVATIAVLVH